MIKDRDMEYIPHSFPCRKVSNYFLPSKLTNFIISSARYMIKDRDTGYLPEVITCIWTAKRVRPYTGGQSVYSDGSGKG